MKKQLQRICLSVATLVAFWMLAVGSTNEYVNTTNYTRVPIKYGVVESNIRIVAEDGSFELKSGEQFQSPFQSDLWNCALGNSKQVLNNFSAGVNCGAKRVKVYVGDSDEPLYGILALNRAIKAASGPAARSYLIRVPQDKINAAREGRTAVAFEYMNYRKTGYYTESGSVKPKNLTWYGWVLWLSKFPL